MFILSVNVNLQRKPIREIATKVNQKDIFVGIFTITHIHTHTLMYACAHFKRKEVIKISQMGLLRQFNKHRHWALSTSVPLD